MSFAQLSAAGVFAGLAGLAAVLYALQRLRIRHRPVTVVTTMFWRVAAEEAPARTLVERFRHPWAYALVLLIAALLWLAFADPEPRQAAGGPFHVLVLDGSAGMAAGARFPAAVSALQAHVRGLPADQRQVLWSGGGDRTLLNPGEHELLLAKRLAHLAPVAAPAGVEALVRQIAATRRPGRTLDVVIFGDAPIRAETLALTPELHVSRARLGARPAAPNAGLTALGVTDAASGAWNRVDVYFRVEGDQPVAPSALALDLDGQAIPANQLRGDAAHGYVLPGLPAAGGLLTVRLTAEDALALDNVARLRLPDKPRLKVQLSGSLADALRPVLASDPAVEITEVGAQVVIRRAGENLGGALPALEFVPAAAAASAFVITHPEKFDAATVFDEAVRSLGLLEIDAMSLAEAARRPVAVSITAGPQWRFAVWAELLSAEFNFTQSRAFPLFIAHSLRWLAGARAGFPYVAAGRPLPGTGLEHGGRVVGEQGRVLDPLGVAFMPERAGELRLEKEARSLAVSLLDPAVTVVRAEASAALAPPSATALFAHPALWLLAAALVLLGVEWYLHQTGRVP